MKVIFNEYLEPSYELDEQETQELEETGYVEADGICITNTNDKFTVYKETDFDTINLNVGD